MQKHRSSVFFMLCFCFIQFSFSISIINPDYYLLLSFQSSSDPSNSLTSWSSSSDPCTGSWLGVTCHNNRVTRLVLQDLNLSGPVQSLLQLDQLRVLSLKNNTLISPLPLDFSLLKNIKLLFLSNNHLSGPFPSGIANLRRLHRLDLAGNRLVGHIPTDLSKLPHLITLRLERNLLTGTLFDLPPTLSHFNVSGNNLEGEVPKSLSTFPFTSFEGNENLCGLPLQIRCSGRVQMSDPMPINVPEKGRKISRRTLIAIILTDVAAMCLIVGIFVYCCCWRRRKVGKEEEKGRKGVCRNSERRRGGEERQEEEMVVFEGCEGFEKVEDLLRASAEMLGKGSVGTTYKAVVVMEGEVNGRGGLGGGAGGGGGKVLVVKRVRERRKKTAGDGKKEVDSVMMEIGKLRHENVVPLRAYYCSKDEILLVYDFMPNGSLHSLLHGDRGPGRTPLDWNTRLKLASGAARGLDFLHTASESKLAHGHLTSSNIVVDHHGNACISDFALHHVLRSFPPMSLSSPNNAYRAPELLDKANTSKLSRSSDVYSFGVVLLEILTGKMAGEGEGADLAKWVRDIVREEPMSEVFDLELLSYREMEGEMVALLQVALLCLASMPRERPKMSVVYKMIEDIRARGCGGGGGGGVSHSPSLRDLSSNSSPCLSEDTPTVTSS